MSGASASLRSRTAKARTRTYSRRSPPLPAARTTAEIRRRSRAYTGRSRASSDGAYARHQTHPDPRTRAERGDETTQHRSAGRNRRRCVRLRVVAAADAFVVYAALVVTTVLDGDVAEAVGQEVYAR